MLPNLIVIGAMKCGTSSLHYYLSLHPEIFMSERKELNFFIDRKNWSRGLSWYETQFPKELPVRGESSPGYTKYPTFEGVPERIHTYLPDAKLIYLIRDPIERIVSHYMDSYSFGRENGTIEEMLADLDGNHYVNCSRYFMQLERYLDYYPESQILVTTSEELKVDRNATLQGVFRFLGVDECFYSDEYSKRLYESQALKRRTRVGQGLSKLSSRVGSSRARPLIPRAVARPIKAYSRRTAVAIDRPVLGDALRQRLADALADDVECLREFTGKKFERWSL
jgi:sulfotransferase family protein